MIVDLHLDLLLDAAIERAKGGRDVFRRRHEPDLRAAGVAVQVLPLYADEELGGSDPWPRLSAQLDAARLEEQESGGSLRIVRTRAELDEAVAAGAVAGVLALESADGLEGRPERLRKLHDAGVRMVGLTWNGTNGFAGGVGGGETQGLTDDGRRLLGTMEELGVALDLAHLGSRSCEQALEVFEGRVLASHANAAAVHCSPRNLADDVLAAVGERAGVVGLAAIPAFTGPGDFADRLADHHAHITAVAGAGTPAFGADFCDYFGPSPGGGPLLPPDPSENDRALAATPEPPRSSFYAAVAGAVERRAGPEAVAPLCHGNALRFLRAVLG